MKNGTEAYGARTKVKIVKNKVAPPFRRAEFDMIFGKGISKAGDLLDLAVEHSIVSKAGTYFNYDDTRLGQGRENARQFLIDNVVVNEEIRDKVLAILRPEKEPEQEAEVEADSVTVK